MFKKPVQLGQGNILSGADRKKFKKSVLKALNLEGQGEGPDSIEGQLDALIPNKQGSFHQSKVAAPSKMLIFTLEGTPLFIDTSGKGDIVPSVYALWQIPTLLPTIHLKHHAVSQYLLGGADLMVPGVFVPPEGIPTFDKGALLSVTVRGNPAPIAVGRALIRSSDFAALGGKGKLLEIVHVFGDHLWSLASSPSTPNDGFYSDCVVPLGAKPNADSEEEEGGEREGEHVPPSNPWTEGDEPSTAPQQQQGEHGKDESGSAAAAAVEERMQRMDLADAAEEDRGRGEAAGPSMTPEEYDELLKFCVLQALHTSVADDQLPMPSSAFWSIMLGCRPPATTLDIKKSSYKKLSKLIEHFAQERLWVAKEDKRTKELQITSVNRKLEPLYTAFKPVKIKAQPKQEPPPDADASGGAPAPLVISELYKCHPNAQPVLRAVGRDVQELYSAAQIADIAFAYIKLLESDPSRPACPDPSSVLLDPILTDSIYKGFVKKGDPIPTQLKKADIRTLFVERQLPNWVVSRGSQRLVRKGPSRPIQVSTERRQGNKVVTKVVGVEDFLIDPDSLAEELKHLVAGSTTVEDPPGSKQGPAKNREVFAQGDHRDKVGAFLQKHYGVPAKFLEVKKDGKKK